MSAAGFLDADAPIFAPDPDAGPDGLTESQRRANRFARRLLVPLVAVLAVLLLVYYVFFDFSKVDGLSMYPTLHDGDRMLITKGLADPKRGDVVVLNVVDGGVPTEWVKRIVGLPGDRLELRGNEVLVNGAPEPFKHAVSDSGVRAPVFGLTVPAGTVFCMGDGRDVSLDSRYVGPFAISQLHGKVVAVYSPVTRIHLVPEP